MKIMCTVGVVILYDYMFCAYKVPSREFEKANNLEGLCEDGRLIIK
jgi:hypothetical protein